MAAGRDPYRAHNASGQSVIAEGPPSGFPEAEDPAIGFTPEEITAAGFPLIRRYTTSPDQKLTPQILQMNGNPNDTRGGGGTCFGDSGRPVFLNGFLVAVTSYGYTSNCRYLGGYQRVDIPVAQEFLGPVLAAA